MVSSVVVAAKSNSTYRDKYAFGRFCSSALPEIITLVLATTLILIEPPRRNRISMPERAILAGFRETRWAVPDAPDFDELAQLADTAGARVVDRIVQRPGPVSARTYLGQGKVGELHERIHEHDADLAIFNADLSPLQVRNLEKSLEIKVLDRTQIILDIFAMRARSNEGKIQVELAQLEYLLPRISGRGIEMSRLGGGIGTRGPGETKLESDRRRIRTRISVLRRKLEKVESSRAVQRGRRMRAGVPVVSLIGYTNSGKTTLFNALSGETAFAENKLFATLDPLTRRIYLPGAGEILITDTVGFIRDLPVKIVEAFKATLEEIAFASLLLHVVDVVNPEFEGHISEVNRIVEELGADRVPSLMALNKIDRLPDPEFVRPLLTAHGRAVPVSAKREINLEALKGEIDAMLVEKLKSAASSRGEGAM